MAELFYTGEFKKNIKSLSKKYPHIKHDLKPVLEKLATGEIIGDRIPQTEWTVFKFRLANSDNQKGKSGGYRVIYCLKTPEQTVLLTIYSKSERVNISTQEIRKLVLSVFDSE